MAARQEFAGEIPTYKKAIREQYESAINNYNAQENDFLKKNF